MVQYRKISDVSPGLILFQRHFFEAYNGGGDFASEKRSK